MSSVKGANDDSGAQDSSATAPSKKKNWWSLAKGIPFAAAIAASVSLTTQAAALPVSLLPSTMINSSRQPSKLEQVLDETDIEKRLDENKEWVVEEIMQDDAMMADFIAFDDYKELLRPGLGDAIGSLMNFIFPEVPGTRHVMFLPYGDWGRNRIHNPDIDFKLLESKHYELFTYNRDGYLDMHTLSLLENEFERNKEFFGFTAFPKKLEFFLYNNRRDYKQSNLASLPVLEFSAGLTSPSEGMRMVMPFAGEESQFKETLVHELFHAYSMSVAAAHGKIGNLPLWFIEGTAEFVSEGYGAQSERVVKDLYINAPEFNFTMINRFGVHPISYKGGCFIAQVIADEFGRDKIAELYKGTAVPWQENVQRTLGISERDLFIMAHRSLEERYGHLKRKRDITDIANQLGSGRIMAADGDAFLTVGYESGRIRLKLNRFDDVHGVAHEEVIADQTVGDEALRWFRGADINNNLLSYVMTNTTDELRVQAFAFDQEEREFDLGDEQTYTFDGLQSIFDPTIIDHDQIAFIGHDDKYANIFVFNRQTGSLVKLTNDKQEYSGLDYDKHHNRLVFSREDGPKEEGYALNKHLYTIDLLTNDLRQLTFGEGADTAPRFSPDGNSILFTSDRDRTSNLYHYDLGTSEAHQLSDARVAAFNPHWISDGKLLFNSVNLFRHDMYAIDMPSEGALKRSTILSALPQDQDQFFKSTTSGFERATPDDLKALETLKDKEAGFTMRSGDDVYRGVRVVPLDDRLIIQGVLKKPDLEEGIARTCQETAFFELRRNSSRSLFKSNLPFCVPSREKERLRTKHQIEDILRRDPEARKSMKRLRKDHTILDELVSPDGLYIVAFTNNKMNFGEPKAPVSAYVLDTKARDFWSFMNIEGGVQSRFDGNLKFLSDGKILWITKPDPEGYEGMKVYDLRKGDPKEIFDSGTFSPDITQLTFSKDRRYTAAVANRAFDGEEYIAVYDAKTGKEQEISIDLDEETTNHLKFLDDGTLFFTTKDDDILRFSLLDVETGKKKAFDMEPQGGFDRYAQKYQFPEGLESLDLKTAVIAASGKRAAVVLTDTESPNKREKLFIVNTKTGTMTDASGDDIFFEGLSFVGEHLVYVGKDLTNHLELKAHSGTTQTSKAMKKVRMDSTSKNIYFSDGDELYAYGLDDGKLTTIAENSFGFDMVDDLLVYSKLQDRDFQTFVLDTTRDKTLQLSQEGWNAFLPHRSGKSILFYTDEDDRLGIRKVNFKRLEDRVNVKIRSYDREGFDLGNAEVVGDDVIFTVRDSEGLIDRNIDMGTFASPTREVHERLAFLEKELSDHPFQNWSGGGIIAGGWGPGAGFFGFVDGHILATDRAKNHAMLLSALGNMRTFNMISLSYFDLVQDWGASLFIEQLDPYYVMGTKGTKQFPFGKFHKISLFGGYEYQNGFFRKNNHVLKAGASYGLDTTQWNYHGPRLGSRLFLKVEEGFSASQGDHNNIDANLEARTYFPIGDRATFALRAAGGTSQGPNPTLYVMGGVDDIKGTPLFSLYGQNYHFESAELRFPIADVAGVIFTEPARGMSILTAALEVHGKFFAYTGDVFNNYDVETGNFGVPSFGVGYGLDWYWLGLRFTLSHTVYGMVNTPGFPERPGKRGKPGWNQGINWFIMMPNW